MDWLSDIRTWLSDNEAMISAIVGLAVLVGIVFTGIRLLLSRRSEPTSTPASEPAKEGDPLLALPTGPVVAVLPFENLSRDPDQEYFSDGLTDDIITALSRFKDLFVIARNSTFRYKGQAVDVRQLNKELGARYVLEGSVQKAGDSLRVTAQLLNAKDGTHLWAEAYDRELSASNIFAVQDEITEQVVATIAGAHGVISRARFAEVKERPAGSLDAYESVLHAQTYFRGNSSVTEHAEIRDALEHAAHSNPGYADAWAYLCFIYLDEYRYNYNPRANPLDRALDAARRAVALDPANQRAHFALSEAHFYRKELEAFLVEAERVISLNPNDSALLAALGWHLGDVGDERGIVLVRRAIKLDPFHPKWFHWPMALYHFRRGEFGEALAEAQKSSTPPADYWLQLLLTAIYSELDRQGDAKSTLEEVLRLYPGFNIGKLIEDLQKLNMSDEGVRPWVAALRKVGLPD